MESPTEPVTAEIFARAETDQYFGRFVQQSVVGTFYPHHCGLRPIDGSGALPTRRTSQTVAVPPPHGRHLWLAISGWTRPTPVRGPETAEFGGPHA